MPRTALSQAEAPATRPPPPLCSHAHLGRDFCGGKPIQTGRLAAPKPVCQRSCRAGAAVLSGRPDSKRSVEPAAHEIGWARDDHPATLLGFGAKEGAKGCRCS